MDSEGLHSGFRGEDRSFGGNGLFVDLVPQSCWFTNVRSCVTKDSWDRIRKAVYGRAGYRCEVCGAARDSASKRWIEAHERWQFDDTLRIQKLVRLVALCSDCHTVTHFGLAKVWGVDKKAFQHLVKVTGMTEREANDHIREAFRVWEERSKYEYSLDLRILTDSEVELLPEELSLSIAVKKGKASADVVRVADHPAPGEPLVQNADEELFDRWEITFSAPKAFSDAWEAADPETREKLKAAQGEAIDAALVVLDREANAVLENFSPGEPSNNNDMSAIEKPDPPKGEPFRIPIWPFAGMVALGLAGWLVIAHPHVSWKSFLPPRSAEPVSPVVVVPQGPKYRVFHWTHGIFRCRIDHSIGHRPWGCRRIGPPKTAEKSRHTVAKKTAPPVRTKDPVMSLAIWNGPRFGAENIRCSIAPGRWIASYKPVLDPQGRFVRYTGERVRIYCPK